MANELNCAIGQTGLTVTARRILAGTVVAGDISCPEVSGAGGAYCGDMAGDAGVYSILFLVAGAIRASGVIVWDGTQEVTVASGEVVGGFTDGALTEIRSSLNGVIVTVNGPVLNCRGRLIIVLVTGDDYSAVDGRQIDIDLDGTTLPDLTSATVELVCESGDFPVAIAGSATVPTGSSRTVRFQPAAADTVKLTQTVDGEFWVRITPTSGRVISPIEARGCLKVLKGKQGSCA